MIPAALLAVAAGILSTQSPPNTSSGGATASKAPAPSTPDTIVQKSAYTDALGTVVKISPTQITLKVAQTVPNGYTTKHVHVAGQKGTTAVQIPKTKVIHTDITLALGTSVAVKTASGKDGAVGDIKTGETVQVHVTKVREAKPGEKYEAHLEVTKIIVPNSAPTTSTTSTGK